jgi:hypothetical protein
VSEAATVPVRVALVGQERLIGRGSLAALLDIEIEVGGLCLPIHGVQIRRPREGSREWEIHPPHYKGSAGQWRPAIELPDVILRAIVEQLTEEALADLPCFALAVGRA